MFQNILNTNQSTLLPLIQQFSNDFYLVGGTAIALQIGHRKSIDFDLFSAKPFNREHLKKKIKDGGFSFDVIFEDGDQLHGIVNDVRLTFYEYPYPVQPKVKFMNIILMPSLLSLGAMKAYALGRRAKWKDYVDLFFLLRDHFDLDQLCQHTEHIYGTLFSQKLLRQQLTYFKDINYSEPIEYVTENIQNETIEHFLTDIALEEI